MKWKMYSHQYKPFYLIVYCWRERQERGKVLGFSIALAYLAVHETISQLLFIIQSYYYFFFFFSLNVKHKTCRSVSGVLIIGLSLYFIESTAKMYILVLFKIKSSGFGPSNSVFIIFLVKNSVFIIDFVYEYTISYATL